MPSSLLYLLFAYDVAIWALVQRLIACGEGHFSPLHNSDILACNRFIRPTYDSLIFKAGTTPLRV